MNKPSSPVTSAHWRHVYEAQAKKEMAIEMGMDGWMDALREKCCLIYDTGIPIFTYPPKYFLSVFAKKKKKKKNKEIDGRLIMQIDV